jgi:MmyB-like transcription regulator ligand binding domain
MNHSTREISPLRQRMLEDIEGLDREFSKIAPDYASSAKGFAVIFYPAGGLDYVDSRGVIRVDTELCVKPFRSARPQPRNLLNLMFDPAGMQPFVANWEEVARKLIQRVYRESVASVIDEKSQDLISALLAYSGAKPEWRNPPVQRAPSDLPVIPIRFMKDGETLSYFSMLTTLATPQAIATQELRIESMFPMDGVTETHHARIMNQAQNVNH